MSETPMTLAEWQRLFFIKLDRLLEKLKREEDLKREQEKQHDGG